MRFVRSGLFCAMLSCLPLIAPLHAQTPGFEAADLEKMRTDVSAATVAARSRIEESREIMRNFASADPNEREAEVMRFFDGIESEARSILDEVHPNSDFMDALDATRERLIALRNRFERDPPSAQRDERLALLEAEIERFVGLYDDITGMEKKLVRTIIDNSAARREVLRDIDLASAVNVVNILEKVVDDMSNVVDAIQDISGRATAPDDGAIASE